MTVLGGELRAAAELAATVAMYRYLISPCVRWSARGLRAGVSSAAFNGAYPEKPVSLQRVLVAVLAITPLTIWAGVGFAAAGMKMQVVPAAAVAMVGWKCLTFDYDVAREVGWQRVDRVAVALIVVAALFYPPLLFAAVVALCGRLGGWTHHSMASLRIIKAAFTWQIVDGTAGLLLTPEPRLSEEGMLVLLGTAFLSHYVAACKTKIILAGDPWGWIAHNRTDLLIANAYAWGWARWLPRRVMRRIIRLLSPWVVFLNAGTLALQALGVVAFTSRWCLIAALLGAVAFNATVALLSGLLFWENIGIALTLAVTALQLPAAEPGGFGVVPWLLSIVLFTTALCGWSWHPTGLGWWDTPYVSRVYWTARTTSSKSVGIYNNLLSPHDREYGRSLGDPLTSEPLVTFPMGGVENAALRDRLMAMGPASGDLQQIKDTYGWVRWDAAFAKSHIDYLRRFFRSLNAGVPKSPLPPRLRWLKAPGSHLYYWGDLPAYRRETDGPIEAVQVRHQEIHFQVEAHEWLSLRDELLFEISVTL
ncbi:hypothetical protein ABZ478_19620 [Streptomyces sp. NPDC005706]|uniref:hypothetical protein n=1 Tax=Streptomyces sp. NPDC005706 TaxID=3157169 RepID=UPI0033D0ABA7